MPAPIGTDLQLGFGFETADQCPQGYDGTSGITRFLRVKNLSGYYADRPYVRVENLDPSGQMLQGRNEQATISPKFSFQPDVNSLPWLLTHFTGYHGTITELVAAAAYSWPIRPYETGDTWSGSGGVSYVDSLAMEVSMGDAKPNLVSGVRFQDIGLKISEGKLIDMDVAGFGCTETYCNDVAEVAVNAAFTGRVLVRGHRSDPTAATAIKMKVTTDADTGFIGKVKFTKGVVAYGATEHTIASFGQWVDVILADETHAGVSPFEPLQVCILDAAATGALLTIDDEWTIANTRTAATASYSTLNVLGAAGAQFKIGGTSYPVHSLDIKFTRPRKASFQLGSKYAATVQNNGVWGVQISLDRDANDRTFLTNLISAGSVAVTVDCYGDQLSGANYQRLLTNIPAMQVQSLNRDISNPNVLPEKITLNAYRSGTTPIFDWTLVTGKATLAS